MTAALELSLADFVRSLEEQAQGAARLDLSRPLRVVAQLLRAASLDCFQGSHAPDGTPWAPLKRPRSRPRSRPRDKRAKKGGSQKPLLDTGLLQASVTAQGGGHVEQTTPGSLVWGTNVGYALFHQEGTRFIPARPFLGWSEPLLERVEEVLLEHLARRLGGQHGLAR